MGKRSMIETTPEGHKILIGTDGTKFFLFDSDRINEGIRYVRENQLQYIGINSFIGFKGTDISFLRELSDFVEGITIAETYFDLSILNELHRLVFLGFADNKKTVIDLSNFPNLSMLACEYSKRLLSLESCEQLRNLTLTGFKSVDKTIEKIPPLSSLITLNLFITNITSLGGIDHFPLLRELILFRASRLENIAAVKDVKNTLTMIEFDLCKQIRNYEVIAELTNLEKLIIGSSGPIESLAFVKSLEKLQFLSFVGTNVLDGDLYPALGIKYVGFDDKRHYSHKFQKFSSRN